MFSFLSYFFSWLPTLPRILFIVLLTVLVIDFLVHIIIKIMDMIPFV